MPWPPAVEVRLQAEDREYLLFDWLKALLHHFDAEHLLFRRFEVNVTEGGLEGRAWGEPLDRARHEAKAIRLLRRRGPGGRRLVRQGPR